jgi:hypothetical protein
MTAEPTGWAHLWRRVLVLGVSHDVKPGSLRAVQVVDGSPVSWFLAQAVGARSVKEIGTSRGVSTLWLADAARAAGGTVATYDTDPAAPRRRRGSPTWSTSARADCHDDHGRQG